LKNGGVKMRRNHNVRVHLTQEEKIHLSELARNQGLHITCFVRLAIKEYELFHIALRQLISPVKEESIKPIEKYFNNEKYIEINPKNEFVCSTCGHEPNFNEVMRLNNYNSVEEAKKKTNFCGKCGTPLKQKFIDTNKQEKYKKIIDALFEDGKIEEFIRRKLS
jgi:NADH pyrophosphatase NudC (nudix superfamily)